MSVVKHFIEDSIKKKEIDEKEKEVGELWKAGTLQDPPNLPNAETGYFPAEFAFSEDATDAFRKWGLEEAPLKNHASDK